MKKIFSVGIIVTSLIIIGLLSLDKTTISGEYNSEEKCLYYTIDNISMREICYDRDFKLYEIVDDRKVIIYPKADTLVFSDLLTIKPLGKVESKLSIIDIYGDLSEGHYVLEKSYKDKNSELFSKLFLTFEIKVN